MIFFYTSEFLPIQIDRTQQLVVIRKIEGGFILKRQFNAPNPCATQHEAIPFTSQKNQEIYGVTSMRFVILSLCCSTCFFHCLSLSRS